ncbi:TPA: DEAD/DEAH box helicase family protein [Streptococcus suis]|nr:DEAD/DEAH box helicase family protein [Streptococcus suis]
MKLTFERLEYQEEAVKSVIDTLSGFDETANELELEPEVLDGYVKKTLLEKKQKYLNEDYLFPFPQFNIEMETGTGKTMVYLKTICEIHKRFGENNFIIVVPSKAIKAGVEDSLKKLRGYLSSIHNTNRYEYFVYDSKKLSLLQNFENSTFTIMLTTIQAFNSDTNVINQEYSEGFFGGKPLDVIQNARPIVIIDEPQSVDGAKDGAGKKAIQSLHPKFVLRYSATHKDAYPLLYQFGPVQAYQGNGDKRFVKQIETLGTEINTDGNLPIVELKSITANKGQIQAKVYAYKEVEEEFEKKLITIKQNENLYKKTNNPNYEQLGNVIEINRIENFVEFENGFRVTHNQHEGEQELWLTSQLTSLVRDHLDRELTLQKRGIKVLSLIFLDSVENYRIYNESGWNLGEYAKLFESIYETVIRGNSKYKALLDYNVPVSEVHDGYFAMDKGTKNRPARFKDTKGDTASDETAYEAIMSDKEGLLTQYNSNDKKTDTKSSKLRFIFSHSALKEGWDNPNVFQILTIATPKSDLTRRQKIGRGLRISVNQKGERVYGDHNVVTIYANETFEEFAEGLQKEYIEAGLLTNKISDDFFCGILVEKEYSPDDSKSKESESKIGKYQSDKASTLTTTEKDSRLFVKVLKEEGLIKKDSTPAVRKLAKISDKDYEKKLVDVFVEKGGEASIGKAFVNTLKVKFDIKKPIDRRRRKTVEFTDKDNAYFVELWEKISHKVKYKVQFEEEDLLALLLDSANPITDIQVTKMSAIQTRARLKMADTSVGTDIVGQRTDNLIWMELPILDVTKQIADKVGLTRSFIIKVIKLAQVKDKEFIDKIKQNPSLFVKRAVNNIKLHQRALLNRSLLYVRTGEIWSKEQFQSFEASDSTLWEVPSRAFLKTLYKAIAMDSEEEKQFANALINEEKIKYFLKLPNWFKIPTPFGNYNPDWAILAERDNSSKLYFIVDTKTTREKGNLKPAEQDKLNAGMQAYQGDEVLFKAPVKVIGDLEI